jgi:hypothetical protein
MKKHRILAMIRAGGILRTSTACILAGGITSCDNSVEYVMSEKDAEVAVQQAQVEKLDTEKSKLIRGEVSHNFKIEQVGYYHAGARDFFEHPYGFERQGRYFINGVWQDESVTEVLTESRPSHEALKKIDQILENEQGAASHSASQPMSGGFGMGNYLMMYWLLSGNTGRFSPGAGFNQASRQASNWQSGVDVQRRQVDRYAAANPGYQRMAEESRATGVPIRAGQSVRSGFGTSSSRSGSSSYGG